MLLLTLALEPMGEDEAELRSFKLIFVRSCETPGKVGADQMSPPPAALVVVPDPSGGEEVIQLLVELGAAADQVSLVPKMLLIVLELKGGRPAAVLLEPGAELRPLGRLGAGPKLSIVGS